MKFFILLFILISVPAQAAPMMDLTHPFNEKTIYWPTAPGFKMDHHGGTAAGGYYYAANTFSAPEHGGTHMDAPLHFAFNHQSIDKIPIENLIGNAAVIDLSSKIGDTADYAISRADIEEWEKTNGPLSKDDIVLFYTGWDRFWGNKKKFLGADKSGETSDLHFPGLSEEAARYLVEKKVKGIGLDTASLDTGNAVNFPAHRVILGANIYGLENVANLKTIPARGFQVLAAPMKIERGTGAPTRILAWPTK